MERSNAIDWVPGVPELDFERHLWSAGIRFIAGIDEAGRGPIAGPVYAAAVILPPAAELQDRLQGVRDSKQMDALQRDFWAIQIRHIALDYGIGFASPQEIDGLGIVPACHLATRRALQVLRLAPDYLISDYLLLQDMPLPQTSLVKGDRRSLSVAAASILAKTARDVVLCEMDGLYSGYGFAAHKGYATPEHFAALARLGPCPIHRFSFAPLKEQPLMAGS